MPARPRPGRIKIELRAACPAPPLSRHISVIVHRKTCLDTKWGPDISSVEAWGASSYPPVGGQTTTKDDGGEKDPSQLRPAPLPPPPPCHERLPGEHAQDWGIGGSAQTPEDASPALHGSGVLASSPPPTLTELPSSQTPDGVPEELRSLGCVSESGAGVDITECTFFEPCQPTEGSRSSAAVDAVGVKREEDSVL